MHYKVCPNIWLIVCICIYILCAYIQMKAPPKCLYCCV